MERLGPVRRALPPLNAVRAFEATARLGSVGRAGDELGVTHGAVSRQLGLLEGWLGGAALFERSGRGLRLTAAGEAMLAAAGSALDALADAARRHRAGTPPARVVRVNALATFSLRWLLPRLAAFRAGHPGIAVRLTTSNAPIDGLPDDWDVVIRGGPDSFHGMRAIPVLPERRLPVCSPALRRAVPLDAVADLRAHTLLHVSTVPRLWRDWLAAAGVAGLRPAAELTLDHFFLSLQAAADGLGVAVGPSALVADDLAAGRLVAPFPAPTLPARTYYAYLPEPPSADSETFCAWLTGQA